MKYNRLALGLALGFLSGLLACFIFSNDYTVFGQAEDALIRVNKRTGKTWVIQSSYSTAKNKMGLAWVQVVESP